MKSIEFEESLACLRPDLVSYWDEDHNDLGPECYVPGSNYKAGWKCPEGHTFVSAIAKRCKAKSMCIYCSGSKLWTGFNDIATTHPDLAAEYSDENPDTTAEVRYTLTENRLWVCPTEGHTWVGQVAGRVKKGFTCSYCDGREILAGFNDLETVEVELMKCWDDEKNDINPQELSPRSNTLVHWKCPEGHMDLLSPKSRIRNKGDNHCAFCSNRKTWKGDNDIVSKYPEIAREWDKDKNAGAVEDCNPRNDTDVIHWVCSQDDNHKWEATARARTRDKKPTGCPYCTGQRVHVGVTDLATTHPDIAASWHPTLNGDTSPTDVTSTSGRVTHWRCTECAYEWSGQVYSRCYGGRNNKSIQCARCTNRVIEHGINDLSTVNPDLFAQIHPTLNADIDLTVLAPQSKTRIVWSCLTDSSHDPWAATVDKRGKQDGSECPTCFSNVSKGEAALRDFILSIVDDPSSVITSDRKTLSGKEIDVLIPDLSIGVEYNGIYWHNSTLRGDRYHVDKSHATSEKDISLIHVWEDLWSLYRHDVENMLRLRIAPDTLKRISSDSTFAAPMTGSDISELHLNKAISFPEMTSVHFGLYDIYGNLLQVMSARITSKSDPADTLSIRYNSGDIYVEDGSTVLLDAMIDYASLHDISHVCIDVDNDLSDHSYLDERAISSSAVAPIPQNIFGSVRIGIARKTSPDILHIHDSGSRRYRLM